MRNGLYFCLKNRNFLGEVMNTKLQGLLTVRTTVLFSYKLSWGEVGNHCFKTVQVLNPQTIKDV